MNLNGKKITLHDMTLRDGMHPKRHQITLEQMKSIAQGLDAAGVPLIEVTHGDGLGGGSVNYGFAAASDEEYLGAVIPLMKQAKVSALLLPGIGTAVGEDANTIEEVFEPFLVQNGFLQRTNRGRIATPKAYAHFGYVRPGEQAELL